MRLILLLVLATIAPSCLVGQDDIGVPPQGTQPTQRQLEMPQFGIGTPPSDQPLIGFSLPTMPNDEFQSLHDPSVVKDLEIVADQLQKIGDVEKQYSDRFQALVKELMAAGSNPDLYAGLQKQIVDFHNERTESIKKILLPHQLERIKQINRQTAIELSGGISGAFRNRELAETLSLTDEQLKELKEIQQAMTLEIAKKTRQCKESARDRTLKILTADQSRILKELTGDRFVRKTADWNERYGKSQTGR